MTVLVVDDSRAMRLIMQRELHKAGYDDVVGAEDAEAAVSVLRDGGIDLVLADWYLPGMLGIELLRRLRAAGDEVALGFVTSESAPDVRARALGAGASFFITKPFTSEELDGEIKRAAGGEEPRTPSSRTPSRPTLSGVLRGLLGREVTVEPCGLPRSCLPRGVVAYRAISGADRALAVVEMPLVASLACALARIPASEAREWGKAHSLSTSMEANFYEVANVIKRFASRARKRLVVESVATLTEGENPRGLEDERSWHGTVWVEIAGYPAGCLGFVRAANPPT